MSLAWLAGMHHATALVAALYTTYMQFIQSSLCPETDADPWLRLCHACSDGHNAAAAAAAIAAAAWN